MNSYYTGDWLVVMRKRVAKGLCGQCGKVPHETNRKKCRACLNKFNAYHKQLRQRRNEAGLCIKCGQRKKAKRSKSRCSNCLNKIRDAARNNAPKHRAKSIHQRSKMKHKVYDAYGGFLCACCGETEPKFLSIDHVDNNGAEHRKKIGEGGDRLLRWLVANQFPEGFQILCANCNQGKKINKGICPHKEMSVD